jgi:pre-mRNA-splicing factor ISY1
MARNEEKAHAMLNRWVAMKKELNSHSKDKRPGMSTECNNLQECERWRGQIIKEITKKVADIQNASLGEYKIREINDEINKLFREKGHWEDRIRELGGPDHKKLAPKVIDSQGYELPGAGGYKYWGAARDLPGVRELFAKEAPNPPKKSRADLYKNINFEYYGFKDEDDGMLLIYEKEAEKKLIDDYNQEIKESLLVDISKKKKKLEDEKTLIMDGVVYREDDEEYIKFRKIHTNEEPLYNAFATKPSEEEIEKILLEKKKNMLINMYQLDEFEELEKEASEILKENKVIHSK